MLGLHNKKAISFWIVSHLLIVGTTIMLFAGKIIKDKEDYLQQAQHILDDLHAQQHFILQQLAKDLAEHLTLPPPPRDLNKIVSSIKSLEDLSFILAKQGLAIPVSAHVVSLSAQHPIIGSNGVVDSSVLAPDEDYYLQVVENPAQLVVSKRYVQLEMPEYWLLNWGLVIRDKDNYYGHLDIRVAQESIENFLTSKLSQSYFFSASLSNQSPFKADVTLRLKPALLKFSIFSIVLAVVYAVLLTVITRLMGVFSKFKRLKQEHIHAQHKIDQLGNDLQLYQGFVAAQQKYRRMQHELSSELESVDLKSLLLDVAAVNAVFLHERKVNLQLPDFTTRRLLFRSNQLFLMRVLSGIVYECAQQLPPNSTITLQVEVSVLTTESKLKFIFKDNGYYTTLTKQQMLTSAADITCFGWENIIALINENGGNLEHKHAAYQGNTIMCSLPYQAVHKVINLADYCLEA